MPKRICLSAGCRGEVVYRGRCRDCSQQRERSIDRAGKAIYGTRRWALTRRRKLTQSPICERCEKELADTVHHIVDLAEDGDPYALDGLAAWCASCHSKETRMRQQMRTKAA